MLSLFKVVQFCINDLHYYNYIVIITFIQNISSLLIAAFDIRVQHL